MAKKVLLYSSRKAKTVNVDVPEFDWTPFSIVRTVTRLDTGGDTMTKPPKGKNFDPKDDNTRIFALLDAEGQDELYIKEIGVLNASEGWIDSINVTGDTFELKAGAEVRSTGSTLEFRVA